MPRVTTQTQIRPPTTVPAAVPAATAWDWVERGALALSLALAIARATMLETIRDPMAVIVPGADAAPHGPGAAVILVLDLLCLVPALLVLARRAFDRAYALRVSWADLPLLLLAGWLGASALWASDKFAAAVSGANFGSALVLLWSTSQLVRSWLRFRLVAAVCFGLLLVLVAQGVYYRFVEVPDLQRFWQEHGQQILRERGDTADSAFTRKVLAGEVMGFYASPNTFAAVLVMLAVMGVGAMIQRLVARDRWGWATAIGAGVVVAAPIIYLTQSRSAFVTLFLAGLILIGVWVLRDWLARHTSLAYALGLAGVVLVVGAVVSHGLKHGTLLHDSLTFRWHYWVGATGMFKQHPWLGVGWENFGAHYLAHRLPVAAEEVRDPHNLFVRAFAELGTIGGVLLVAWLARVWWEMTRPTLPAYDERHSPHGSSRLLRHFGAPGGAATSPGEYRGGTAVPALALIAVLTMSINVLASVDLSEDPSYVLFELLKRGSYVLILLVGSSIVALHSLERQELDDRPAPWLLYGVLTAIGVFLIHNLIDFSLFEAGPALLFALLVGSVLGLRQSERRPRRRAQRVAIAAFTFGLLGWVAFAAGLVVPVVRAEALARDGDAAVIKGRPHAAVEKYGAALNVVPYDADYAFRAARALVMAGEPPAAVRAMFDRATSINPRASEYYATRATFERARPQVDLAQLRAAYERFLELDPHNITVRLDYADALRNAGLRAEAARQYELALLTNSGYAPAEPERLPPERAAEIGELIKQLRSPAGSR